MKPRHIIAAALLVASVAFVRNMAAPRSAVALSCPYNAPEWILLELRSVRVNGVTTTDTGDLETYAIIASVPW